MKIQTGLNGKTSLDVKGGLVVKKRCSIQQPEKVCLEPENVIEYKPKPSTEIHVNPMPSAECSPRHHLDRKKRHQHVHVLYSRTSWSVCIVWVMLSILVAMTSVVSFVQPEWVVREDRDQFRPLLTYDPDNLVYMLGLYGVCYRDDSVGHTLPPGQSVYCYSFGGLLDSLAHHRSSAFPSFAWHTSCFLFGFGCILFGTCALFALAGLACLRQQKRQAAIFLVGYVQVFAVLLQTAALLIFPFNLATTFTQSHCGLNAGLYRLGSCHLGWAFVLGIISTVLGFYCPILVRFTAYEIYGPCRWNTV